MSVLHRRIAKRRATNGTVLGVGEVIELGAPTDRIDAVRHDGRGNVAGQSGDRRIVRIRDDRGIDRQSGKTVAPDRRDVVDLAVPVELIAKQVSQDNDAWLDCRLDPGEHRLVDLEERTIGGAATGNAHLLD
jgi:hypothetical protein